MLRAQRAVRALARQAVAHGAELVRGAARPDGPAAGSTTAARSRATSSCGRAAPGSAACSATTSRSGRRCQELFFFDGGPAWAAPSVPAFVDFDRAIYGTRDLDGLGVKAAPDLDGPPLDPDAELPDAGAEGEAVARRFLAERFPALADAPLAGSKCCRYELTPDSHFVAAPHPEHAGVWLLGGGSGHGFKHGPALAEQLIGALEGAEPPNKRFALGERSTRSLLRTAGAATRE